MGCAATVPEVAGPTHPYMLASPGCWQVYNQLCADWAYTTMADPMVRSHHVDCYAVQHPGNAEHDRRQRQSVAVHLVSLCLLLELGQPPDRAGATRSRTSQVVLGTLGHTDWPFLAPPETVGPVTVADLNAAVEAGQTEPRFTDWVQASWTAWADHHPTVRGWARLVAEAA